MELHERLEQLADRARSVVGDLATEEAAKTALVLPFLGALGYDVFNPTEVVPEFTADVGMKRGEKVDYAVCVGGKPEILLECKPHGARLDNYSSQLYRYFSVTPARIAVLTDGVEYRFYSDLMEPNKLDPDPFMRVLATEPRESATRRLLLLSKDHLDVQSLLSAAEDMTFKAKIRRRLAEEADSPSEKLIRALVDPVYDGTFTKRAVERFGALVQEAMKEQVADAVDRRLRKALEKNEAETPPPDESNDTSAPRASTPDDQDDQVETTAEELHGYYIVKAITHDMVSPNRVVARDVRSYFGVLLDDNNRKPICRLWFNGRKKHLGVFDAGKKETRIPVASPDDLFKHAEAIRQSLSHVLGS